MSAPYQALDSTESRPSLGSPDRRSSASIDHSGDKNHAGPVTRFERSNTVTSLGGFDFHESVLPLTLSSGDEVDGQGHGGVKGDERHVGLLHGMALIVGTQVGSGIFSSPGVVVAEVGSVGASLSVWVVSALLAWTGASSFAELGCAIPLSGGAQAYLAYAFGPMVSYLYTWTAVSALKPGSAAIISLIFGEYVNRMIYHAFTSDPNAIVPEWTFKVTAIIAIILVSILNLISRSMGTNSAVFITTIKLFALLFVGILGTISLIRQGAGPGLQPSTIFDNSSTNPANYAIALYSGLWAFDGWDACCFVAGEMKNTHRDLPRALHSSMTIVLLLFLGANVSYFIVLSTEIVASTNTVALDFGSATIGKFGAVVFSTLVAISCFGALSNSFYTTAKLIHASAKDRFLPDLFARIHPSRRTPDNAMFLQASLTSFFVVFGGGFRTLLNFFSVTSWTFYLLTVLGLLVLRVKEPNLERPYKAYITTPIIFCAVAMFLLLMPIFAAPVEALAAFAFMSLGVPMFYLTSQSRTGVRSAENGGPQWKGVATAAWGEFQEDVAGIVARLRVGRFRSERTVQVADPGEESHAMLRGTHIEMSDR